MLTYEPAKVEQYDEFLQLMRDEASEYLEHSIELIQMTWQQFSQAFKTVGKVYGIYEDDQLAGFYWIEERRSVSHLHGIVLKSQFQGKGTGSQALEMLATKYRSTMDTIELGVHESNERAKRLYERLGYQTVKTLDDVGFYIMQKPLPDEPSSDTM